MQQFHHKAIKRFDLSGQIYDESMLERLKNEYIRLITIGMQSDGYVPRLDIPVDFTLEYIEKKEIFEFTLSIYAVYVGKRNSQWITGIDGYKAIPIQQNKSSEFSQDQESTLKQN